MADSLRVLESSHGKPMVMNQGYLFRFDKFGAEKRLWECERRREKNCPVRIHTTESLTNLRLLTQLGTHNHEANPINCEVKLTLSNIRKDAKTSTVSPAHVIARNIQQTSSSTQGALNMKRGVRKVRVAVGGSLIVPHRREDIDLPQAYQISEKGRPFLLFDSGPSSDRILIFSTPKNMKFLKASELWFVDGTFKTAPTLFEQLFVIHGYRNGITFPLVYFLTPNRTTETYVRMLTALKLNTPGMEPKSIMSDFEKASINAFNQEFPLAEKKGCFFHFSQSIFRHIRDDKELHHRYSNDSDFSLQIWQLVALAFIPPEDVMVTFEHLMEDEFFVDNEELLAEFITYFEKTWLGRWNIRRTARLAALFPIPLWNCFYSVLENLPKTNNSCEGFHHAFANYLGAIHPTIYKLIDGMKEKQVLTDLAVNQFNAGNVPPPNKKYESVANELKKVVEKYGTSIEFSHIEYLRRVAYRIRHKD